MRTIAILLVMTAVLSVRADHYHPANPCFRIPPNHPEASSQYWINQAQDALKGRVRSNESFRKARNVVLFIGDGMSVPTLTAARILLGQRNGAPGEEAQMCFEKFPTTGLVKTYCVDNQIADSACTATAYLCGIKTNTGNLGINAAVKRGNCVGASNKTNQVESIAEWALSDGRDAGFVTTTRVTHASPGAMFAKTGDRNWETDADIVSAGFDTNSCPDITHQLVHLHPGNKFKVILGGGRGTFIPTNIHDEEGVPGRRIDGRNLIEEWKKDKRDRGVSYKYLWNRKQLLHLNDDLPEYLLGLFDSSHMQYHLEADPETEPTLTELTETAIKMLSRNEKGFFLFVEGGRIDHAHHDNLAQLALDETLEMNKAVARAIELLSEEDSLIVVSADHAHVMAINGYTERGSNILGHSSIIDSHNRLYMTLSYTNGPGFRPHENGMRPDITAEENFRGVRWRSHVDIPLVQETHGGDDVAVFARGPYHSMFTGLYEQNHIPHIMAYAACIGPGEHACSNAAAPRTHLTMVLILAVLFTFFSVRIS